MPQGRRRKPIEQQRAKGNPGKHGKLPPPVVVGGKINPVDDSGEVPVVRRGEHLVPAPPYLPAYAKEFWGFSIQRLIDSGFGDRMDVVGLEQMATLYARIRVCGEVINQEGYWARGSTGQWKEHPAVKMERECMNAFRQWAVEFGLTPASRASANLTAAQTDSLRRQFVSDLGDDFFTEGWGAVVDEGDWQDWEDEPGASARVPAKPKPKKPRGGAAKALPAGV